MTAPAQAAPTAGPGASGPDLSQTNRTVPRAGLPDWSRTGYRGGLELPGSGDLTSDASCRITRDELASTYKVIGDDGVDDTAGLQKAIDDVKSRCSPNANFHRLSLIELPYGRVDISRQIYVDANFLTIKGMGSDDGGTKVVFRPDLSTRYDQTVNGRWDQESMTAGNAPDMGNGGWIWPGRGMFRVQTRDVAARYQDEWEVLPPLPGRKDLFEGSVNQHWVSGFKLASLPDAPGFSGRRGANVVRLDPKADTDKFKLGGYVWVGAANSKKFYAQQGITDPSMIEALHMRQQMFRVTHIDATTKTITLDEPLEWDLPVNSESDGSEPLNGSGNPYPSKITPLKTVEGVGFEDFAFTQDMNGLPKIGGQETYSLSPDQAKNNYGNMAPEYAMHGIVFKWAANSWARGLRATMTGSHPIVTEVARNLQIERNSFDGAWNKGKGGNGYLRGSRVWDSLWAYNLSRNLRHFTFQWSASGNVAFRNDLDSDLNLHGGWEHSNLFEQNTVRIPYDHRSASCQTNCGGEGGEIDDGTWYPVWWAAGPKAGKWAGSSGPQNVFYNNTLIKQTTPNGPFEPYAPYGTRPGVAFQFGSDSTHPGEFQPLSQDGQAIADWTGRETLDFQGQGVATLDLGKQHSLFLRDTGGEIDPREQNRRKVITWNMQGAGTTNDVGEYESKYDAGVLGMMERYQANIVLLQEAGSPPGGETGDRWLGQEHDIQQTQFSRGLDYVGNHIYPPVRQYRISGTRSRPAAYLYWLHTDTSTVGVNRVNLAIATSRPVDQDDVYVVQGTADRYGATSRPALGVRVDGVVYFTVHGWSGTGNDAPELLANIRTRMATAGPNNTPLPWVALGDYNRLPHPGARNSLYDRLAQDAPGQWQVMAPSLGQPTHPTMPDPEPYVPDPLDPEPTEPLTTTPRVLDYAVAPSGANAPQATGIARVDEEVRSDHYPVLFEIGNLPEPPSDRLRPVKKLPARAVLRNAKTTNVATYGGYTSQVTDEPLNRADVPMQTFSLDAVPEFPGYYRLVAVDGNSYLGQPDGDRDARIVLNPNEETDQLWRPVDQGDGTWILENMVSHQLLTSLNSGEALMARDFDNSGSQRWFLQDPATEATRVDEILLKESTPPLMMTVADGRTEEGTSVDVRYDTEEGNEGFITIYADKTGDDHCYYLAYGGKYVNATATQTLPQDGNRVTLNTFRPNDDGYLWCATFNETTMFLSNHTAPDERLYLDAHGENQPLTLHTYTPGLPVDLWAFDPVTQ
ncbi:RICIN domain-containing protein [Streptomyces sp. NPDC051135]|uniref:RICIN domain-containing protein n=1 Tax=unclassified Streptomyces TaxID=2593676 RepID=UPI0034412305